MVILVPLWVKEAIPLRNLLRGIVTLSSVKSINFNENFHGSFQLKSLRLEEKEQCKVCSSLFFYINLMGRSVSHICLMGGGHYLFDGNLFCILGLLGRLYCLLVMIFREER